METCPKIILLFMLVEALATESDIREGIIVSGGQGTNEEIELYLPNIKTYSELDVQLYFGRSEHISAALDNHRVLVAGGKTVYSSPKSTTGTEIINMKSLQVNDSHDMLEPRAEAAAAVLKGFVYICGGTPDGVDATNSCEFFDGIKWKNSTKMQSKRMYFAMAELNDKIYALGGRIREVADSLSTVEVFTTESMGWHRLPDMTYPRAGLAAAAFNGTVVACGGKTVYHDNGTFLKSCEMFDPEKQEWNYFPSMTVQRKWFDLVEYRGELFALGGINTGGSVERYNLTVRKWETVTIGIKAGVGFSAVALRKNAPICLGQILTVVACLVVKFFSI